MPSELYVSVVLHEHHVPICRMSKAISICIARGQEHLSNTPQCLARCRPTTLALPPSLCCHAICSLQPDGTLSSVGFIL